MGNNAGFLEGNLFSQISMSEQKQLLIMGKFQTFHKDEFVFQVAKPNNAVHIIINGQAKIFHTSSVGKEIILWFCLPGEMFGLAGCLNNTKRKIFAQACGPTKILSIKQNKFKHFLKENPHIALVVIELLSTRMQILSNTLLEIATEDVESRIRHIIQRLAQCYGVHFDNIIKIDFAITHQEIANMIGASRQTVTSIINQLKQQNLLYVESHKIYLIKNQWDISPTNLTINIPDTQTSLHQTTTNVS